MKTNRKFLPVLLVLLVLLFLFGRTSIDGTSSAVPSAQPTEDLILVQDLSPAAEEPGQTAPSSEAPEDEDGAEKETLPEDGSYTSKEEVMQYLLLYGHLPKNYITKAEAEKAGWNGGSLERILPDSYPPAVANIIASLVFGAVHIHKGIVYMVGAALLLSFFGILYSKQKTIWGLCIPHLVLSWSLRILW